MHKSSMTARENTITDPLIMRHDEMSQKFLDDAITGGQLDMAKAILFCLFKPPELMDTNNRYTIIYDPDDHKTYHWNNKTLLWQEPDKSKQENDLSIISFDNIIWRYNRMCDILVNQIKESDNVLMVETANVNANANAKIRDIRKLLEKLQFRSNRVSIWKDVLDRAVLSFSTCRDKVSAELPLNDGTLFNIFTHEIRRRNIMDLYTFTLEAHIVNDIKSIKPDDNSSTAHKVVWKFFFELMSEDEEMTIFLITTLAIYISGDVRDQSFMIMVGDSNNGKSLLLSLLQWLLSKSASPGATGIFIDSGSKEFANSHTSHLSMLAGLRLAYLSESKCNRVLSANTIKQITAGDSIASREAYTSKFTQLSTLCHLILSGQFCPQMDIHDQGICKRARIIHFKSWFRPEGTNISYANPNALKIYDEDKHLASILMSPDCCNAILTIFSIAAYGYYHNNYKYHIPQRVIDAVSPSNHDSFKYSKFIDDVCVVDPQALIKTSELHKYYVEYMSCTNTSCDSSRAFRSIMKQRFMPQRSTGGYCYYFGITVDCDLLERYKDVNANKRFVIRRPNNNSLSYTPRQNFTTEKSPSVSNHIIPLPSKQVMPVSDLLSSDQNNQIMNTMILSPEKRIQSVFPSQNNRSSVGK